MRETYHLVNTSTIIWYGEWSNAGYENVAEKHLVVPDGASGTEFSPDEDDYLGHPVSL